MNKIIDLHDYRLKKKGVAILSSYERQGLILDEAIYTREEAERILANIDETEIALHDPDGVA